MLGALYDFFYTKIFLPTGGSTFTYLDRFMSSRSISLLGDSFTFREYASFLASIISLIIIFVLCCLFVYKIIKLIGGLIR